MKASALRVSGLTSGTAWRALPANAVSRFRTTVQAVPWERCGIVLFAGLLLLGLPIAVNRAVYDGGGTDFPEFYAAGRYLLEHGVRNPASIFGYYLPSMDVAWVGLAVLPLPAATVVWYYVGCATYLGLLSAIGRYLLADVAAATRRRALLSAGLLMMPLALDGMCLGAFHILMVWLLVEGLGRVSRRRDFSGGMLVGLAVWIKLLPILAVGYLTWKRKWGAALTAVATVLVVNAVLSMGAYGPRGAWQHHQTWWQNRAKGAGTTLYILASPDWIFQGKDNNQSVAAVMRRTLSTMGLHARGEQHRLVLADLRPAQLKVVFAAVMAVLCLGVLAFCRRSHSRTSVEHWSTEIALVSVSTFWVSPVSWSYHALAMLPALGVVLGRNDSLHGSRMQRTLAWSAALAWLLASALMASHLAKSLGEMLWMSILLAVMLQWTLRAGRTADAGNDVEILPFPSHTETTPPTARAA